MGVGRSAWRVWVLILSLQLLGAWPSPSLGMGRVSTAQNKELEQSRETMVLPELTWEERLNLAIENRRNPDKYHAEANQAIQAFSDKLEERIRLWLAGKVEAEFPKGFLPPSFDNAKTHSWRLTKPEEIDPREQWFAMDAYDPAKTLHQFSPDPRATYLKLIFIAPLGAKLLVGGDFPHARFMDYEILTPVDPDHPVTGQMGICEVPIVDADIEPDPGHVNPFRVGADRTAKNRHYHVTFELKAGNAVTLNPRSMIAPQYRGPGNTRVGGPFVFTGPIGRNVLVPSLLWLRYYGLDKDAEPYGGVDWPKATLQLSTGERFWITCDKSLAVKLQTDPVPRVKTPPLEPYPFIGPSLGWFKMFGIVNVTAESRAYYKSRPWGQDDPVTSKARLRQMLRAIFNQGPDAPPPGNYANAATECNYNAYLTRPMNLGADKVIVLTGKLPVFPKTRNGEPVMQPGEVRYFSFTHQLGANAQYNKGYYGTPYGSLMDDEIVINDDRDYVIVFSRKEDRPANAKAEYGVTWQDWGTAANQTFVVRWMSVMPEWYLPKYSFHENNAPWNKAGWAQENFDKSLFMENRRGFMGPYHPLIHYMTQAEFEAIGNRPIRPGDVPEWKVKDGSVPQQGQNPAEIQQKVEELKQGFENLRKAREAQDPRAMRESAQKIRRVWDELPEAARVRIEEKFPGIRARVEQIKLD
jgi:hypothetical protein